MKSMCLRISFAVFCLANLVNSQLCVIGGGISGAAFSDSIRQNCANSFDLHLFEQSDRIGGRVFSAVIDGNKYEVGASVFIQANAYMVDNAKRFNLTVEEAFSSGRIGVFDGNRVLFSAGDNGLKDLVNAVWRYGFGFQYTKAKAKQYVEQFLGFYEIQKDFSKSFADAKSFWNSTGLLQLTQNSFEDELLKDLTARGFGTGFEKKQNEAFMNEVIVGFLRNIYNQGLGINALAGYISMAAINWPAFYIKEGNDRLVEKLAEASRANVHLNKQVSKIQRKDGSQFKLFDKDSSVIGECDQVVIATPLETSNIQIEIDDQDDFVRRNSFREYQTVWSTFVHGTPNPSYFNLNEKDPNLIPSSIFTTDRSSIPFKYFGYDLIENGFMAHFFSEEKLSEKVLSEIFEPGYIVKYEKEWKAYPKFSPPERYPDTILAENLYYINSIENGASCMEIMSVAARNIASLVCKNERQNSTDKEITKDEL